ncbi:MAG: peptide-methionine (S)-S-oxide reductase MsrA [Spirochaetales bacterium]|nr:peptide-methionine (S)-S-oxide reductase MsrA [Spirochaetales bacterium]
MNRQSIVLGGGCFWCIEALYRRLDGVIEARSGYAGGHLEKPTYKEVCTGSTGHAEVVEITFDRDVISLEEILAFFWKAHDPTTPNRQGADVGTQYRSIILYRDEEQKRLAEASLKGAQSSFSDPIVTEIEPLGALYPAEDYHNDYYEHNPGQGYCRLVIEPKIAKLGFDSAPRP